MGLFSKIKSLFSFEEDYEYEYIEKEKDQPMPEKSASEKNVVNLASMKNPTSKVVLCEPRTYNEVQEIADHIVNRRAAVINLERVDHQEAKRIVDFLSGAVYSLDGEIQKLGSQTFLCVPDNIEISGSISDFSGEYETNEGW